MGQPVRRALSMTEGGNSDANAELSPSGRVSRFPGELPNTIENRTSRIPKPNRTSPNVPGTGRVRPAHPQDICL